MSPRPETGQLHHGGRLRAASAEFGIPLSDWLDLSTGIAPHAWPVAPVPAESWHRLPEEEDGLEAAARHYYGAPNVLALAGSQAAIRSLPGLRAPCRVGVLSPSYAEHAHAWLRHGHMVHALPAAALAHAAAGVDVLVVVNPNNPGGERFERAALLDLHATLAARGGWLVVDEAFADATPNTSLASFSARPGLIVLRSLGKFFGLAGARVGFALAAPELLNRLDDVLGPWTLSGPSRRIACAALCDAGWQAMQRERLAADALRLERLLRASGLAPDGGCALFQWVRTDAAAGLHQALARKGILTRLFDDPASLRFGLPGQEAGWQRLASALADIR